MFPRFEVVEVNIVVDEQGTDVVAHGQTPLFKTKEWEQAVRKWLGKEGTQIGQRVKDKVAEIEN